MSFDWNVVRYRPKDLAIVAVLAGIVGLGVGQCASQESYDAGYRRAVVALSDDEMAPPISNAEAATSAAAIADAAAVDAAAAAADAAAMSANQPVYSAGSADMSEVAYSGENFRGMACTEDCSGHEAGYVWAEDNGISDPDECGGQSNSFIEGCMAWAEENQ